MNKPLKTSYKETMQEIHDFLAIEELKKIANDITGKERCICDIDKMHAMENKKAFKLCRFCQANELLAKIETIRYLTELDEKDKICNIHQKRC